MWFSDMRISPDTVHNCLCNSIHTAPHSLLSEDHIFCSNPFQKPLLRGFSAMNSSVTGMWKFGLQPLALFRANLLHKIYHLRLVTFSTDQTLSCVLCPAGLLILKLASLLWCHQHLFFYPYQSVWPISSLPVSGLAFSPLLLSNNTWKTRAEFPVPANVNFVQTKLPYSWKFSTKSSCSLVFSYQQSLSSQAWCYSVTLQLFLRGSENNCRFLLTWQFNSSKAFSSLIFCNYSFWSSLLPCLRAAPAGLGHVPSRLIWSGWAGGTTLDLCFVDLSELGCSNSLHKHSDLLAGALWRAPKMTSSSFLQYFTFPVGLKRCVFKGWIHPYASGSCVMIVTCVI